MITPFINLISNLSLQLPECAQITVALTYLLIFLGGHDDPVVTLNIEAKSGARQFSKIRMPEFSRNVERMLPL